MRLRNLIENEKTYLNETLLRVLLLYVNTKEEFRIIEFVQGGIVARSDHRRNFIYFQSHLAGFKQKLKPPSSVAYCLTTC